MSEELLVFLYQVVRQAPPAADLYLGIPLVTDRRELSQTRAIEGWVSTADQEKIRCSGFMGELPGGYECGSNQERVIRAAIQCMGVSLRSHSIGDFALPAIYSPQPLGRLNSAEVVVSLNYTRYGDDPGWLAVLAQISAVEAAFGGTKAKLLNEAAMATTFATGQRIPILYSIRECLGPGVLILDDQVDSERYAARIVTCQTLPSPLAGALLIRRCVWSEISPTDGTLLVRSGERTLGVVK